MTNPDNTQTKLPSAFTSRRHFIQTGAALLGAAWLGTLVQSKLFPQASTAEAKPITLALADLPVGSAREITYAGAPAIVLRTAESIKAFSWSAPIWAAPCNGRRTKRNSTVRVTTAASISSARCLPGRRPCRWRSTR